MTSRLQNIGHGATAPKFTALDSWEGFRVYAPRSNMLESPQTLAQLGGCTRHTWTLPEAPYWIRDWSILQLQIVMAE